MPIIEWKMDCQIGIQEIDRHHKNLVSSLNKAYDLFREGKEIDLSFLHELINCSSRHFACEEAWMRKTSYPNLEAHQEEHDMFTSKILVFEKEYKHSARISVELLWFLCNWVTHHIKETDAEFGRFVDSQQIRRKRESLHAIQP